MSEMETAHQIRGIVARAVVHRTNDEGESQTADVTIYSHVERSEVEILHPAGFASRPRSKSALMVVLAVGGDQGDLVGLPVAAPGDRLGKLKEGEVAIHGTDGSRVHIKDDHSIDILSSKKIVAKVKEAEVEIGEDMIRAQLSAGGPRVVVRPDYVKMRFGGHWIVIKAEGIFSSVPIVVGPDPEPEI